MSRMRVSGVSATLVWLRQDLRLADNPALQAAVLRGGPVVPVFVWAPKSDGAWTPGGASRWWLHQSLQALAADFEKRDARLILRIAGKGGALAELRDLARATGAGAVYWNRRYEPAAILHDAAIKQALRADGVDVESYNAALLFEPWTIRNLSGKPFQVFTPYWKACLAQPEPPEPVPAPRALRVPKAWPVSEPLTALRLEPRVDWASGMRKAWTPGEKGAQRQLSHFLENSLSGYDESRNTPGAEGTSRLSPYLHFGELGSRQIWHAVRGHGMFGLKGSAPGSGARGEETYLRELGWREFAHHLLFHFPHTPLEPLRPDFARFPWVKNVRALKVWQRGRTGYPIVDAGLRELWATGWMHNRVRMIVGSFLVKDLLLPWQDGARWFWDTLVDADLANNTLGWQWTAGCGADAAPYFRIFNPVSQGERFDPKGSYVRHWVPELARVPDEFIHRPWEAPPLALAEAGVALGAEYPRPIVNHAEARDRALEAFAALKNK